MPGLQRGRDRQRKRQIDPAVAKELEEIENAADEAIDKEGEEKLVKQMEEAEQMEEEAKRQAE